MFDYLIVGAGLFGSVFAYEAGLKGKKCLVIDKRPHIGGNVYTQCRDQINIHMYGAHIFHTSDREVWDFVNRFAKFNNFVNSPLANFKGELYNLPFNMNTFYKLWGEEASTPLKAKRKFESQISHFPNPSNLEEQALSLVGKDIYEKLIKSYTQKQWGRPCSELPPWIIKRIPVRFRFDNNYFDDTFQGVPVGGYSNIIRQLLSKAQVRLNEDYNLDREGLSSLADKVLYTGTLDSLFDFRFGKLAYRSEVFKHKRLELENFQGAAVMNFTDFETPYTRVIEHKHFEFGKQKVTWISYEYPVDYEKTGEPFYPICDKANLDLYKKYRDLALQKKNFLFGGRLADFKYYDMDDTIRAALNLAAKELSKEGQPSLKDEGSRL